MQSEKHKKMLKYSGIIILFILYTILIPTISLNRVIKIILDIFYIGGIFYLCEENLKKAVIKIKKHPFHYIGIIFGFWILSVLASGLLNNFLIDVLNLNTPNNTAQLELLKDAPFYLCFSMLLFSPLIEEVAITIATRQLIENKWIYLISCGLLCGIMYVAFSSSSSYWFILPYFFQEVIWAYAYLKSENILVPIGIHFIQNFIAVLTYATLIG